uniref:hypothetical protein n=1 Tax=Streptomyces caniscabiei TaxID=2746961 RepID=UPI0038F69F28
QRDIPIGSEHFSPLKRQTFFRDRRFVAQCQKGGPNHFVLLDEFVTVWWQSALKDAADNKTDK